MRRLFVMGLLICLAAPLSNAQAQEPPRLAVASVEPVAYMVQRVGGARFTAEAMVRPGQEPHTFEPTPRQMARLAAAEVYFTIGLPFEDQLARRLKAANRKLAVFDAAMGIKRQKSHRDHEEDPHIWLSPALAIRMARNIAAGLSRIDPKSRDYYYANLVGLVRDLRKTQERMARDLAPYRGRAVLVYHPAFGYLLGEFGLRQWAMQAGGKEPSARALAGLIGQARKHGIKVIFVQSQFTQSSASAMAQGAGMRIEVLDPLAADYLANLERMAGAIARSVAERLAGGGS